MKDTNEYLSGKGDIGEREKRPVSGMALSDAQ